MKCKLSEIANKLSFNKENPTELISQLFKILKRDVDPDESKKILNELKRISNDIFNIWKKRK